MIIPVSDVDILIDVPVETRFTLFDIAEIQENLRHAIKINVDVVMLRALAPKVKKRIQKDLKLISLVYINFRSSAKQ